MLPKPAPRSGRHVADIVDAATRSRMMSGIRSRNTKPELVIRTGLHRLGFRYGLHNRKLRGTPDLVLPKYHAVIFVHGCFWHGHSCSLFKMPSTRVEFWKAKFLRNQDNDRAASADLRRLGWRILTVWECALRGKTDIELSALLKRIERWLKSSSKTLEIPRIRHKGSLT
jgi:DNA mismatch endonuclease, patch repair protein